MNMILQSKINYLHCSPPSPLPSHNGFPDPGFMAPFDSGSMDSRSTLRRWVWNKSKLPQLILNMHVTIVFIFFFIFFFIHTIYSMDSSRLDDEHKLIARYAQRLAQEARTMVRFFINSKILTFNVCCLLFYTTIWIYV